MIVQAIHPNPPPKHVPYIGPAAAYTNPQRVNNQAELDAWFIAHPQLEKWTWVRWKTLQGVFSETQLSLVLDLKTTYEGMEYSYEGKPKDALLIVYHGARFSASARWEPSANYSIISEKEYNQWVKHSDHIQDFAERYRTGTEPLPRII